MAEARLAVAFKLQVNDDGNLEVKLDRTLVYHVLLSLVRTAIKNITYVRNVIIRTIYPGSVWMLLALLVALYAAQHIRPDQAILSAWQSYIPLLTYLPTAGQGPVAALLLGASIFTVGMFIQRYLLMLLLSYKGFLFVPHGQTPWRVRIWFQLVKLLEGFGKPTTYSFQTTLPCQPLPSVRDTCERYLRTVRHLLTDERYAEMERMSQSFQGSLGPRVQRYLWLWWFCSKNYVSEWWLKYVYLRGRSPIMINSNYYILDTVRKHTERQVSRASVIVHVVARFKERLDHELLDPILVQGAIPLCMDQYSRVFGTTRAPGVEEDTIEHVAPSQSQHFVAMRHGRFYEVPLKWNGRLLTPPELEERLQTVLDEDALDRDTPAAHVHLPVMTAVDRPTWAAFRESHVFADPTNRHSMERVESAAFILVLDDGRPDLETDEQVTDMGRRALHGNGYNRWFDKSLVFTVYENARFHVSAEHAWADAPVVAHITENIYISEHHLHHEGRDYDADGQCAGAALAPLRPPQRLQWRFNKDAAATIERCVGTAATLIADLDLHVLDYNQFGKGAIKKCRVSPDAFVQMALQLAYFRDSGRFALTYEASMTRLYRNGRTETVRPGTVESSAFVHAMEDASVTREQRRALLSCATTVHQDNYRNAMAGRGVDRHLFTMYVVAQYLKEKSPFLDAVLGEPWRLSTSQTPQTQTKAGIQILKGEDAATLHSPGGGFGPVADDGYGVSYILSEHRIFFHVSSKVSAEATNSRRFADNVRRAMGDVCALFDQKK